MKIFKIIILNILFFSLIFGLSEFAIFKYYQNVYKDKYQHSHTCKFGYKWNFPIYLKDLKSYFYLDSPKYQGRKPDGIKYSDKKPIVIFGCSIGHGSYLENHQTFSYKLSNELKCPVYNRSIPGGGIQHMYFQTTSNDFYKYVPPSDTIIYVLIEDQIRRMMINYFSVLDLSIMLHYSIKNNKLVVDNYNNYYLNFLKSLYISKAINHIYANNFTKDKANSEKIANMVLLYLKESKKELETHWNKKIKFYVLMYDNLEILHKNEIKKKLEENGFIVTSTSELTNENLLSEKYLMLDNYHPTEAAWDLLTPKIIEKFGLK